MLDKQIELIRAFLLEKKNQMVTEMNPALTEKQRFERIFVIVEFIEFCCGKKENKS